MSARDTTHPASSDQVDIHGPARVQIRGLKPKNKIIIFYMCNEGAFFPTSISGVQTERKPLALIIIFFFFFAAMGEILA